MKLLERVFFIAGLALFAALMYRIGPEALLHDLGLVGGGFVIIFGQEFLAIIFNTLGWHYAIHPQQGRISFRSLFAMRLAGDAVNYVTPTASIGGEFVKVRLLQREIPMAESVSSVSLAAINQFLSQIVFILAMIPLLAVLTLTPTITNLSYWLSGFVVIICAVLFCLGWRQDFFQRLHAFLQKHRWLQRWTSDPKAWQKLDENIFGSFSRHPGDNILSIFFFTLGWAMGAVEVYLILYFFQIPADWSIAFAIEGLSIIVDMSFFFVPAKAGTQEGGKYFIFLLLGLDPQSGFALGVVRRLREIAWALLGLLAFGYYQYIGRHGGTLLGDCQRK